MAHNTNQALTHTAFLCLVAVMIQVYAGDVSPEVVKRLRESSFRIEASMWDLPIGTGSGFAVGQTNVVVTALHVIQGSTDLKVTNLATGSEHKVLRILAVDRRLDTVRMLVEGNAPNFLEVSQRGVDQGQGVLTYGNPIGLNASLGSGLISSIDPDRHGLIQINTAISPGNSGGPVTTYDGKVVGVVVAKMSGRGAEGIGFAAPISRIANAPSLNLPYPGVALYMIPDFRREGVEGHLPRSITKVTYLETGEPMFRDKFSYDTAGLIIQESLFDGKIIKNHLYDDFGVLLKSTDHTGKVFPVGTRESYLARLNTVSDSNVYSGLFTGGSPTEFADHLTYFSRLYGRMSIYRSSARHEVKVTGIESDSLRIYRSGYLVDYIEVFTQENQVRSHQYYHQYVLDERGNWVRQYQVPGPRPSTAQIIVKQPSAGAQLSVERIFDYY